MAALSGLVWLLLGSPWLKVQRVDVEGVQRLDPAVVRAAAQSQIGRPMLMASTDQVAARLSGRSLILGVEVRRSWPSTLTVVVTERQPAAAIASAQGFTLVDRGGVVVGVESRPPAGVPVVEVDVTSARPGAVAAVVDVLASLPADLRAQVRRQGASTPDDVWLVLAGGATVRWGSVEQSELKATVLRQLHPSGASVYDVSAPGTPAVSQRTSPTRRKPLASARPQPSSVVTSLKPSPKASSSSRPSGVAPSPKVASASPKSTAKGTPKPRTTRG